MKKSAKRPAGLFADFFLPFCSAPPEAALRKTRGIFRKAHVLAKNIKIGVTHIGAGGYVWGIYGGQVVVMCQVVLNFLPGARGTREGEGEEKSVSSPDLPGRVSHGSMQT